MESSDEVLAKTSHAISLCVVAGWPLLSSIESPDADLAFESLTGIVWSVVSGVLTVIAF